MSIAKLKVYCFLRVLRLYSHAQLKYNVLKLIGNTVIDFEAFAKRLEPHKNDLTTITNADFDIKLLATAAPYCYAQYIAKANNFDVCLATELPKDGVFNAYFENIKAQKQQNVLAFLKSYNTITVHTFITDHKDDIFVMRMAEHNFLVNPNTELLNLMKDEQLPFEILNPKR